MTETIIVALIALIGNVIVSWISHHRSKVLIEYRLQQLENKVSLHNNLVERMYEAEKNISILQNDVNDMKGQG